MRSSAVICRTTSDPVSTWRSKSRCRSCLRCSSRSFGVATGSRSLSISPNDTPRLAFYPRLRSMGFLTLGQLTQGTRRPYPWSMPTVIRDAASPTATAPAPRVLVRVEREGEFARVTMDIPERRNALSLDHMRQLLAAVHQVAASDARGLLLAADGPVFCAGHDFHDVVKAGLPAIRELLALCTELMTTLQSIPQPVLARVHGLATAAGCQLVASADLAVASEE